MNALTGNEFAHNVGPESGVVLVDFWAEWCGPCRMLTPLLEEISKKYASKATFYKVNVDQEGELSMQFAIRSIPTVIIFHNGVQKERLVGVQPEIAYTEKIDALIKESGLSLAA
ncbi:MAG TPA: thioredoxin [Candidatus Absconditabacterales bacterium]|nr:thioredoxin [Candidatus Absconditabacterales bacterium]HNG97701.1 thioredoxin [Candidatus Absconditabacterales bacterium]